MEPTPSTELNHGTACKCIMCHIPDLGIKPIGMKGIDPKGPIGAKKPQLALLPPVFNEEVAKALQLGAVNHGPWNWRLTKVEMMTYLHAMRRHIDAVIERIDIDPESGAHHLGHVAANCAIILDARKHGTLVDNRPPQP